MSRWWLKGRIFALLAVAALIVSCDTVSRTADDLPTAPQFDLSLGLNDANPDDDDADSDSDGADNGGGETHEYTLIRETLPIGLDLSTSSLIGASGGSISIAGHKLTIPKGAVSSPTLFTMTLPANGYVEVELTAIVTDILGNVIDVGLSGFNKPVKLALTYARATNVTDPSKLFIAWMPDDNHDRHVPLPSDVNTKKKLVTAEVSHFSKYCMASD
jgi:hypothetical protein